MQAMYQMPFERFERYSPYGTPQQVAEFLWPYVQAGCSTFNVIPCATDHDSAVAAVGELRRLLSDEAENVDSLVVTPEDPMLSQSPVS
jgi:hypothetical protein